MNTVKTFPEYVREHIRTKNLEPLKTFLRAMSAAEIIDGLKDCENADKPVVFRLLQKDSGAEVFDLLDVGEQSRMVESLTNDEVVSLLGVLDPDDQLRLLDELPARVAKRLMDALPREQREQVSRLMGYEDDTVGRIMSPVQIDVKRGTTASEAINRIRAKKNGSRHVITMVYVTDETRRIVGAVPLSAVVTADAS
ncbi:MAG: magnesium transporter, partial [Spirochaetaceae bacterium]